MATKKRAFKQAKIAAVYNQKGGCGKTMTAMQLGGSLALKGYKTLIVEMDPQGTAMTWYRRGEEIGRSFPATVISLSRMGKDMVGGIAKFVDDYDFIIVDCPPAIESTVPWAALIIADIGIVPIAPALDNIWASKEAFELGKRAQEVNQNLQLFYMPSLVRRGNLFTACLEILEQDPLVQEGKLIKLSEGLNQRNAYQECQAEGSTVHALAKKSLAIDEVNAMTKDFLKIFSLRG